jgi:hypothetical protein
MPAQKGFPHMMRLELSRRGDAAREAKIQIATNKGGLLGLHTRLQQGEDQLPRADLETPASP